MTDYKRDARGAHEYDDIIDLPCPTSRKHPRMSIHDRAAQFEAFAALTGHGDAIEETAKEHIAEYEKKAVDEEREVDEQELLW